MKQFIHLHPRPFFKASVVSATERTSLNPRRYIAGIFYICISLFDGLYHLLKTRPLQRARFFYLCNTMNLKLIRDLKAETYTAGSLFIEDSFQYWTIEDKVRELGADCSGKVKAQTAIPAGRYEVIINFSNRFQKYMPLLLAVPCFEGIRIHSGNNAEDSEGCILVGKEKSASGQVFKSRDAFKELMAILTKAAKKEKIFIEVV